VDKQGITLLKEVADMKRKLEQERTQRSFVQRSLRESREQFAEQMQRQEEEMRTLHARIAELEVPWVMRAISQIWQSIWGPCSGGEGLKEPKPLQYLVPRR
jgi:hypothetical protein